MTDRRRILILVPNGATTDNRVVREAESLKRAGHEVLLAGLRLAHVPGLNAITPGGVRVRRVDWQYRAYSRFAMNYALVLAPLLVVLTILAVFVGIWLYGVVFAPLAAATLNLLLWTLHGMTDWTAGFWRTPSSSLERWLPSIETIRGWSPLLYHAIILLTLLLLARLARPLWQKVRRVMGRGFSTVRSNRAMASIRRKVMHARNYGERENVQGYSLLEALLAPGLNWRGGLVERMTQRYIQDSRTRAFVEIGEEYRPEVVQCHEIGSLPAAIELKKRLGCRVVYEAHEIYDDLASASAAQLKTYRETHQTCLPQVDGFITVNEDIGDYYRATYSSLPMPVIMPNSVYPKRVTYDGRLHEAAGLPPDAKIALYQGGFSPNRGLFVLLEAAFRLPDNWYVVFMGKGPLEEDLKAQAQELENLSLEKIQRKLSLAIRAEQGDIGEPLTAAVPLAAADGREPIFQRSPVEDLVLGRFLTGPGERLSRHDIEADIRGVRETEIRLSVEKVMRHELDQIKFSGRVSRARFVPMAPHSELVEWTSGASVGVIPYENVGLNHWFCSPNKIWEYPNAGVPILASRLHYLSGIIERWELGWTFASDPSVPDIVSVVRGITDEDLATKKVNCQRFIEADNYQVHEHRLLDLFARI